MPLPALLAFSTASIYGFFLRGGLFMIPLAFCSLISVAVILLRGLALRRALVIPPEIAQTIEDMGPADEKSAQHLAEMVHENPAALARIVNAGLHHLTWPKSENMEAVQTRARHEIVRLESGLFLLEIIVGIAPLLGLLGAVSGLVSVFSAFGSDAASQDPHGIAKGISEALSTTMVGLAIAIPSLIAYSYFAKKIETMSAEMESLVSELLAKCYFQQSSAASQAAANLASSSTKRLIGESSFAPPASEPGRERIR